MLLEKTHHCWVIPCQISQRWEPDHVRFSHKNYHMHWNVSLAYMQNFSFTVPVTRVFQAANSEDFVIVACTVFD